MAINESFGNLVNDLTEQVLQQVQQQVQGAISSAVTERLDQVITTEFIKSVILSRVSQDLQNYQPDLTDFNNELETAGIRVLDTFNSTVEQKISSLMSAKIESLNVQESVNNYISSLIGSHITHYPFPTGSVPGTAVDTTSLQLTGDNVTSGTHREFSSSGIDDQASSCQLTILDHATIIENTLYTSRLEVKGDALIDGDLLITGVIPKDSQTYKNLVGDVGAIADATYDKIFAKFQSDGLDVAKITIGNNPILEGTRLTAAVIDSQLQTVGVLKDLQTQGETLLSGIVYASGRRVGINTIEPGSALSIWDEEIEIGFGKQKQNVAQIGTTRSQALVLSSNNKNNITLNTDGSVTVTDLKIGNMSFTSSSTPPTTNQPKGTVVFNENPNLGGPMGWISLGDARWANFGIID